MKRSSETLIQKNTLTREEDQRRILNGDGRATRERMQMRSKMKRSVKFQGCFQLAKSNNDRIDDCAGSRRHELRFDSSSVWLNAELK